MCRCSQKCWNGGPPCFCAYQWVPIAEFYVFNSKIVITIVPSMTSVSSESYYLTALIILPNKRCPKHTNEQRFKQRKSTLTQSYDVLSTYLDNTYLIVNSDSVGRVVLVLCVWYMVDIYKVYVMWRACFKNYQAIESTDFIYQSKLKERGAYPFFFQKESKLR